MLERTPVHQQRLPQTGCCFSSASLHADPGHKGQQGLCWYLQDRQQSQGSQHLLHWHPPRGEFHTHSHSQTKPARKHLFRAAGITVQGLIFQKVLTQALHVPQDKLPMHQFPAPTPSRGMRLPVLRHACLVLAQPLPGALPHTPSRVPAAAPCPWHIGFHLDPVTQLIP